MNVHAVMAILTAFLLTASSAFAQYGQVIATANASNGNTDTKAVDVPAGKVMQILHTSSPDSTYSGTYFAEVSVNTPAGGAVILKVYGAPTVNLYKDSAQTNAVGHIGAAPETVIVGPATVYFTQRGGGTFFASYKIFDNATSQLTTTASNTVVIPSQASGTVQMIMEQSEDMITWTAAQPGSFGPSTTKRFFRIRAVQNP